MTPDRLLDHFDRVSDAPDAIPRLRRFILDLAVRGKLVEQDPNDEPVSELRKLLNSNSCDTRFDLPHRWIEAKVGELLEFHYGKALPASERLDQGRVSVFGSNGVVGYYAESLTEEFAIIIGRKGSAGALNLCAGPSWTTDVAYFVTPPSFFDIQFLFIALQTLDLGNLGKGVKPGLSRGDAYELKIVVPPLAEQHRIVAKVDELMALCDRLGAAQAERESGRDRLAAASLHRLNNGADADEFREHARFHLLHLPRLATRPVHIQQLRQTVLNLAVRGKLVPQDPNDEPVNELLAKIQAERAQLIALARIRHSRPAVPVIASEEMFDIPEQWMWLGLADLCHVITDGEHLTPQYSESGVPMLSAKHIGSDALIFKDFNYLSEKTAEKCWSRCFPEERDILVVSRGAGVGRTIISKCRGYCLMGSVLLFKPASQVNERFLSYFLNSPMGNEELRTTSGASAQQAIYIAHLKRDYRVPLPPLAEQHRIVTKVEGLLGLCDRLEAQLTTTQTESHRLLETVLHEALNGNRELEQGSFS